MFIGLGVVFWTALQEVKQSVTLRFLRNNKKKISTCLATCALHSPIFSSQLLGNADAELMGRNGSYVRAHSQPFPSPPADLLHPGSLMK